MIEYKGNLVLGIPKAGSQSLAAYIMGRQMPFTHKRYSEYNREFFNVYAMWRDPVERFKSCVRFERMLEQRRKEPQSSVSKLIDNIDKYLYFKPQALWLDEVPQNKLVLLPFSDFEYSANYIADSIGLKKLDTIPRIHETSGEIKLTDSEMDRVKEFYKEDYKYEECLTMPNL
jgi:hypothetical protein